MRSPVIILFSHAGFLFYFVYSVVFTVLHDRFMLNWLKSTTVIPKYTVLQYIVLTIIE